MVVGNWKMELSHKAEISLAAALKRLLKEMTLTKVDVVVCPSFPSLAAVSDELRRLSKVSVGAQNIHWEEKGAWTGSVSVLQVTPFVSWCIVGHSEVREVTGLNDEMVQQQVSLLLRHGINPIVCIGESWEEREAEKTVEKVTTQMNILLNKMTRTTLIKTVICYEPVWAISANAPAQLPDSAEVASIMLLMRKLAAARFGNEAAERLRILYGGSVKPDTVEQYMKEPGVDGVLVGGASVSPRKFVDIIKVVQDAR